MTTAAAPSVTLVPVNTAAVIGSAMTDYLLASGTNKAPATRAPAHMAAWLHAHGYRIVRSPATGQIDPGDTETVARITGQIDWQAGGDEGGTRRSVVRQVLAALVAGAADARKAA
jgi:hypothetical protein